jgi:hypothetical protein
MPEQNQVDISEQFADVIFFALDHGIDSIRSSGGPLTPFVVFDQGGQRALKRFVAETLELSQAEAREAIKTCPSDVASCAVAYDGYITVDGKKWDAVLVEAFERGRASGVRMAQRYVPKKFLRKFHTEGNAALLGACEMLLR